MFYRSNMPQLDLHGEDRVSARIKVKEFIEEMIILENKEFAIVHGVGQGILREETHNVLRNDKRIKEFKIDYFNMGCTLIKMK